MHKDDIKNIIILKNLPSNLIDEAIMVVKDKSKDLNYKDLMGNGRDSNVSNSVVQGYMNSEDLKKIEKIRKEDRKYVIKEAELVVSNYIIALDKSARDKKIKNKYKRMKITNLILGATTLISIIVAVIC